MLSLINKYSAFVHLIYLLHLIPSITLAYLTIFLVCSAYSLFLSSALPHTCRLAHMMLPLNLICLPFPFHLWRSARSCPWPFSFESSNYASQFPNHLLYRLTLLYADDTHLVIRRAEQWPCQRRNKQQSSPPLSKRAGILVDPEPPPSRL